MTLDALIILSGILITLLSVLPRFPEPVQTALFLVLGVAVIALGIFVRRRAPSRRHSSQPEMSVHDQSV